MELFRYTYPFIQIESIAVRCQVALEYERSKSATGKIQKGSFDANLSAMGVLERQIHIRDGKA